VRVVDTLALCWLVSEDETLETLETLVEALLADAECFTILCNLVDWK
jgi:hypothetical protein